VSATLTTRCRQLADSLAELKLRVRAALATELAQAVGTAVRDVLAAALTDRLLTPGHPSSPGTPSWRGGDPARERDPWGYPEDPWDEPDEYRDRVPARYARDEPAEGRVPAIAAAAAIAVGVRAGRWWLARGGTVAAAVGIGVLAAGLGLAGGPAARAALAVLAAATDLLAAESALARSDPP
jgi:hypothetical protein